MHLSDGSVVFVVFLWGKDTIFLSKRDPMPPNNS